MICDAIIYVFVHDVVMIILMLLMNASDLWMHDFDDDELLVMFCIMQMWCDDIFICMWINYGDVDFMSIVMGDDDMLLCGLYYWVTYIS